MLFSPKLLIIYTTLGVLISEILQINIITIGLVIGFILQHLHGISIPLYDIGILITMLIIGTHLELKTIRRYKLLTSLVLIASIITIIITYFIIQNILHLNSTQSLIIATSLCLSSTLICNQKLEQENAMSTNYGKITIISTIVQDIIGIILLASLHLHTSDLYNTCYQSLGLIAFIILMIYSQPLMSKLIHYQQHTTQSMYNIKASVTLTLLCFGHLTLIPQEIIYFIAGLILKNIILESKHEIQYIQTISMAILFIFAGYNMDIRLIANNLSKIMEILIITTAIKTFILYGFIMLDTKRFDSTIRSVILLSTCSELSFFIISILDLDKNITNIIFATTMLSMLINPVIFNMVSRALDLTQQRNIGIAKYAARLHIKQLTKYVLVIGINDITRLLIHELGNMLIDIVAIDNRIDKVVENPKNCYFMDALSDDTYKIIEPSKMYCIIIITCRVQTYTDIIDKITSLNISAPIYVVAAKKEINIILNHAPYIIPIISYPDQSSNTASLIIDNIKEHLN